MEFRVEQSMVSLFVYFVCVFVQLFWNKECMLNTHIVICFLSIFISWCSIDNNWKKLEIKSWIWGRWHFFFFSNNQLHPAYCASFRTMSLFYKSSLKFQKMSLSSVTNFQQRKFGILQMLKVFTLLALTESQISSTDSPEIHQ